MLSRINEVVALAKRGTPKIGGSSAAFVALVTILVLIIVISCLAVAYLMLEDVSHDSESQNLNRRARSRYQLSRPSDPTHHGAAKTYFAATLGKITGSRKPNSDFRKDNPRISRKSRGQGWLQAGSGSDLDSDSVDERQAAQKPKSRISDNSTPVTIPDRHSMSLVTVRSSNVVAFPQLVSRSSSPSSSSASAHGVRGLSYTDQLPSSSSLRSVIPSIQSQLYSPQSSQSSSTQGLNETKPTETETATASPASLERTLPSDPTDNDGDPLTTDPPRPPIRTFESGSRFIEGL